MYSPRAVSVNVFISCFFFCFY